MAAINFVPTLFFWCLIGHPFATLLVLGGIVYAHRQWNLRR